MKTDKIPFSLSVDELYEILNKKYGDVKKKGDNILMLKYSNTKITINKWTDGYVVKAGLPIWWAQSGTKDLSMERNEIRKEIL